MNFITLPTGIPQFTSSVPVGTVIAFAGQMESIDQINSVEGCGWLLCDGRLLKTHVYPELFSILGYLYGGSEGSFMLPNLSGMFLRGIGTDEGSTESRTKAHGGFDTGIGSTQSFAVQKHAHVYSSPIAGTLAPGPSTAVPVNAGINKSDTTEGPTESVALGAVKVSEYETRPVNMFVNYLIKFRY